VGVLNVLKRNTFLIIRDYKINDGEEYGIKENLKETNQTILLNTQFALKLLSVL
jgi:hypothetical protein